MTTDNTQKLFTQVTDSAGNISYIAVSDKPDAAVPSKIAQVTQIATSTISAVSQYTAARAVETSTHLGLAIGGATAPAIIDNIGKAVIAGLIGDYVGCAMSAIPAVLGIAGSVAAIFTPEKHKGPTNEQIQTAVAALSREQLIGLLDQSVANESPMSTITASVQPSAA